MKRKKWRQRRKRDGRGRVRKTTEGKPDSEVVSLGTLSSRRQQSVSGGPPHPGCCQRRHQALQAPTSPDHQEPSAPGRSVLFYWFNPTPHYFHTMLVTPGQDPQAFICSRPQPWLLSAQFTHIPLLIINTKRPTRHPFQPSSIQMAFCSCHTHKGDYFKPVNVHSKEIKLQKIDW